MIKTRLIGVKNLLKKSHKGEFLEFLSSTFGPNLANFNLAWLVVNPLISNFSIFAGFIVALVCATFCGWAKGHALDNSCLLSNSMLLSCLIINFLIMDTTFPKIELTPFNLSATLLGCAIVAFANPALAEQGSSQISQAKPSQDMGIMSGLKSVETTVPVLDSETGEVKGKLSTNRCSPPTNRYSPGLEVLTKNNWGLFQYTCVPTSENSFKAIDLNQDEAPERGLPGSKQEFVPVDNSNQYPQVSIVAGQGKETRFIPLNVLCRSKDGTLGIPVTETVFSGDEETEKSNTCIPIPK